MPRYLLFLTAAALAYSPCAFAQDVDPARVVVLLGKPYLQYQQVLSAFTETWKEATGFEPRVTQFSETDAKKRQFPTGRPTLIVGLGESATVWALGHDEEFRLAFTMVLAPERLEGFAKLQSTKARHLTGVSIEIAPERQLELLLAAMPNLKRIGVVSNSLALRENVTKLAQACEHYGVSVKHVELQSLAELPTRLSELLAEVDLIWSVPDPAVLQSELAQRIITQCADRKIPLLGPSATFVKAGATISFDPDYFEVGQLLAKQCLAPCDNAAPRLTIVSPQSIVVSVNERSLRALNLKVELDRPGIRTNRF